MNLFTKFPALKWAGLGLAGAAIAVGAYFGIKAISSGGTIDLGMVPDDVDFVASLNVQKMLDQTSIKITDDGIEFPEELSDLESTIPDEATDIIVRCNKAIDCNQILSFGYIKANEDNPVDLYVLAKVKDSSELNDVLEDSEGPNLSSDEEDGFTIYTKRKDDFAVLVKDNYMWIVVGATDSKAIKRVQKILDRAGENSIKSKDGIAQNVNNGSIFTVNVNTRKVFKLMSLMQNALPAESSIMASAFIDKAKNNWLNYSIDLEGTAASLKAKFYNPDDGTAFDFGVSSPVDTHFLTYIPSNFQCVGAMQIKPEYTAQICDGIQRMIDDDYNRRINNAMSYSYYGDNSYAESIRAEQQMVNEYFNALRDIDGTIGAGFGFSDLPALCYGGKPSGIQFLFTAQMKPGAAEKLRNSLRDAIQSAGADSTAFGSGDVVIPIDRSMNLYIKAIGNDIVIANFDVKQGNTNNFASVVQGNEMIAYLDLPSISDLTNGLCNYGLKGEYKYTKGEVSLLFEITNCKDNIVGAIINIANGMKAGERAYSDAHSYDYSDYSDYYYPDSMAVVEEVAAPADEYYYGY